jgi:hypothetical protein
MLTATARRATSVDDEDVEGRESVTGRDGYLICQALGYAITAIEALPDEFQERSNARDMRQLLSYLTKRHDHFLLNARKHLEQRKPALLD